MASEPPAHNADELVQPNQPPGPTVPLDHAPLDKMDLTSIAALLARLHASEERLALVAAAANLGVWDVDIAAGTGIHNREFRALYGLPQDERPIPHDEWLALIHPEDRDRMHQVAVAAQAGEAEYSVEFRIARADTGEIRWIASRGSVVKPEPGQKPSRMVGICYDITDRRREQEHQLLLAREVDHRAKNVLAVVQSIVRLTHANNPRDFVTAVDGRVAALGRAHTLLSRDHWTGARIAEIVSEELVPYCDAGQMALDGPDLLLRPESVQPFSMFLHELATNAAKYGALSQSGGIVRVSWRLEHQPRAQPGDAGTAPPAIASQARQLRLEWVETGGPPITAPVETSGFGSVVIRSTVRGQLEGEITKDFRPHGLHCTVLLPATCIAEAAAANGTPGGNADMADTYDRHAHIVLHGRRVLLAEDEPLLGIDMTNTLSTLGCTVIGPLPTLEQALRTAAAEAANLDVAVLDSNLRGADSASVADLLRAFGVPVIHITGYGTLLSADRHGAQIILRKPLRQGELAAGLRMALAAHRSPRP